MPLHAAEADVLRERLPQAAMSLLNVFAVGFTSGRFAFSEGTVEAVYTMDGSRVIRTTAGFAAGASGGGLFDREGRLVGLLTFYRHGAGGSTYFAVPAQWVSELLTQGDHLPLADDQAPPFWSPEARDLPAFLTAFALEADGNWAELERFALRWLVVEPGSADASAALRMARERQREPQPAGASERR